MSFVLLLLNAKIYITTQNNKKNHFTKMSLVSFLLNNGLARLHCSAAVGLVLLHRLRIMSKFWGFDY